MIVAGTQIQYTQVLTRRSAVRVADNGGKFESYDDWLVDNGFLLTVSCQRLLDNGNGLPIRD